MKMKFWTCITCCLIPVFLGLSAEAKPYYYRSDQASEQDPDLPFGENPLQRIYKFEQNSNVFRFNDDQNTASKNYYYSPFDGKHKVSVDDNEQSLKAPRRYIIKLRSRQGEVKKNRCKKGYEYDCVLDKCRKVMGQIKRARKPCGCYVRGENPLRRKNKSEGNANVFGFNDDQNTASKNNYYSLFYGKHKVSVDDNEESLKAPRRYIIKLRSRQGEVRKNRCKPGYEYDCVLDNYIDSRWSSLNGAASSSGYFGDLKPITNIDIYRKNVEDDKSSEEINQYGNNKDKYTGAFWEQQLSVVPKNIKKVVEIIHRNIEQQKNECKAKGQTFDEIRGRCVGTMVSNFTGRRK